MRAGVDRAEGPHSWGGPDLNPGADRVRTTDTGAPPAREALHPESNTEPDPHTDLRQALRTVLIESVFPAYAKK